MRACYMTNIPILFITSPILLFSPTAQPWWGAASHFQATKAEHGQQALMFILADYSPRCLAFFCVCPGTPPPLPPQTHKTIHPLELDPKSRDVLYLNPDPSTSPHHLLLECFSSFILSYLRITSAWTTLTTDTIEINQGIFMVIPWQAPPAVLSLLARLSCGRWFRSAWQLRWERIFF